MIKRLLKGIRYSPKYGNHPGTPVLVFGVMAGAIVGGMLGAAIAFVLISPLYLEGAWERGR